MANNSYYTEQNKLNPQIAVAKNNKTIIEFLDRLKFESNSAQVESSYSRIRIGIQDFSGEKPFYLWDNLTPEDVRSTYEALQNLPAITSTEVETAAIRDLEEIKRMLEKNPGIEPEELHLVENKINGFKALAEKKKQPVILLQEKKILPYEGSKNPNNPNEYLITGCKIYFNPTMRIPVIFEVSQGYGIAKKDEIGRVQFSGEHDARTAKKMLTLKDASSMLRKVVRFCDNMAKIATDKYFDLKVSGYGETE